MAGAQPEHPYHVRSISFPSRSHPLALQFNDELQKMKTWAAEAETTPSSSEMVCYGIQGLAKLNTCVENILKMPESQKSIVRSKDETWVTEELEGSVRFLDMCDSTRCSLSLLKEQAQDLQCALRTRKAGDDIFESKAKSYITSLSIPELCKKIANKDVVVEVQKQLREIEDGVADLENGLEFLFQGLIRKRVAVLNIINL